MNKNKVNIRSCFLASKNMFNIILYTNKNKKAEQKNFTLPF